MKSIQSPALNSPAAGQLHPLEQLLDRSWPSERWRDVTVLLAVSGGADSVALLRSMHALQSAGGGRLHVAHFNHRLREGDSDADARFVAELCGQLGLPCEVGQAETAPMAASASTDEASLRSLRYQFLQQTAERLGARYVVTAHTADDQAETILHRILRGTGVTGLAGIRRNRRLGPAATLLRPLLMVRRAELVRYLSDLGQPFREDHTNRDTSFTRNRIRHELLPLLAITYNHAVVDSLLRLGQMAAGAQQIIDQIVQALIDEAVREETGRVIIDCARLVAQDRSVLRQLMVALWTRRSWPRQSMGFKHWELLAAMASGEQPDLRAFRRVFPGRIRAERQGEKLLLSRATGE